jgi:hypothetical protein
MRRMVLHVHGLLLAAAVCASWMVTGSIARAQEHEAHEPPPAQPSDDWRWHFDASAFFGFNHQERRFRDLSTWESQNWVMATGVRPVGGARLQLASMVSFEPFTLHRIGSAQVFQTGETYRGAALIDYQHPHDFMMEIGGELRVPASRAEFMVGLDLVGSPTLGPPPFMHRPSADYNPQTPLAHHHLDSTHSTPGVIRGGVGARGWMFEGSWFQGREPDDNRTDLDLGALDSSAVRLSWARGVWNAQVSAGWLTKPELVTPFDSTRLSASVGYTGARVAWTAAFGQNREIHGNLEAYLLEGWWRAARNDVFFTRIESVAKDILDVGFHPVNTFHRHRQSQVGAGTVGYLRELVRSGVGSFGVGADVTGYIVPANLRDGYGSPLSVHAFVRYRLQPAPEAHVH